MLEEDDKDDSALKDDKDDSALKADEDDRALKDGVAKRAEVREVKGAEGR